MESIYNIHPLTIKPLLERNNYAFNFLSNEYSNTYYNLINSLEPYKFINLYRYLYLRILKINKKFSSIDLLPCKKEITYEEFNEIIKKYINLSPLKEIIIINGIQLYFI
jgi:hypothetical protein